MQARQVLASAAMEEFDNFFDEPSLADLILSDAAPIDWGWANAAGRAILDLADELRRCRHTRTSARAWLKMTGHDPGCLFDEIWKQGCRLAGYVPGRGRPIGSRSSRKLPRKSHVPFSDFARPLAGRHN